MPLRVEATCKGFSRHAWTTEVVGIKQDDHLEAGGGLELPDELGGQLRGLPKGEAQRLGLLGLHIEPAPQGITWLRHPRMAQTYWWPRL